MTNKIGKIGIVSGNIRYEENTHFDPVRIS